MTLKDIKLLPSPDLLTSELIKTIKFHEITSKGSYL